MFYLHSIARAFIYGYDSLGAVYIIILGLGGTHAQLDAVLPCFSPVNKGSCFRCG